MDKQLPVNGITISQQCGSGGYMIAARLAHRLRWTLTDHQISRQVACLLGMTDEEAALYDEHTFRFIDRVLVSLRYITPEMLEAWASQYTMPIVSRRQERIYREVLRHVVERIAHSSNRIILEHGAQVILAGRPDVLHIRITAPLEQRISDIAQDMHVSEKQARSYIQRKDRHQEFYFQSQHHCAVNDPLLYDLVINSAALDVESQVDLICLALERKTHWVDLVAS